jgi:hypothetical protein
LKYKNEAVNSYAENLKKLINQDTYKNEIVNFNIQNNMNNIQKAHRKDLIPLIIQILYPKMFLVRGFKHKKGRKD